MRKFKDKQGDEWEISVNMASAMAIKTEAAVDILDIAEGKDLILMTTDVVTMGAVLWLLVAEQAEARQLNEKQFFQRLDGDALDAATQVLVAECFDFFPAEKRRLLKGTYDKVVSVQNTQLAKAEKLVQEMTEDQIVSLAIGNASDLKSPANSASSPGVSQSAS